MKLRLLSLGVACLLAFSSQAQNENSSLKIGGRLHVQGVFGQQDDALDRNVGDYENNGHMRRVRLAASGKAAANIKFKLQFEFAGGVAEVRDVYAIYSGLPIFDAIKVGHFKEPIGLDQLGSSNDMTFIERNASYDMTPGRNMGVSLRNVYDDIRTGYEIGAFMNTNDVGTVIDNAINYSGRVWHAPYMSDDGEIHSHLALGYSYRDPRTNTYSLDTKPEVDNTNTWLNTGGISNVDVQEMYAAEAVFGIGCFGFQGEYITSEVSRTDNLSDLSFNSWYAEASLFLTGESKNYRLSDGTVARTTPMSSFGNGGYGALELAARYGETDFSDQDINGGEMRVLTLGINWHLNYNTKLVLNQTFAAKNDVGDAQFTNVKLQVTF